MALALREGDALACSDLLDDTSTMPFSSEQDVIEEFLVHFSGFFS